MTGCTIKCEGCGEHILQLFDLGRAQKCPGCGRMIALNIVDLSDRQHVVRRLKSVLEREAQPKQKIKL